MKQHFVLFGAAVAASIFGTAISGAPANAAERIVIDRAPAQQPVDFLVKFPLRNSAELDNLIALQSNPSSPVYHHFLTPQQFAGRFGASPATLQRATASLRAQGFTIARAGAQGLHVRGTSAAVEKAFGVRLHVMRAETGTARAAATEAVRVPADLAADGATVIGLRRSIGARVHSRPAMMRPNNRYDAFGPYWFTDLKEAYEAPSYRVATGKGATIGIVISSDVLDSDLAAAFVHEKFTQLTKDPIPTITRRFVFGGAPFNPNSNDSFEASLDVQQSLGSAPGAKLLLYDMPSLNNDAILAAYFDVVNDNAADVISSSFGGCELFNSPAYDNGLNQNGEFYAQNDLFRQGNAQGQTFLASSGDSSGLGCTTPNYLKPNGTTIKFIPGVENPADDPNVTAVGGTNLKTTAPPSPQPSPKVLTSRYVSESEYGDLEVAYDPYGVGQNAIGGLWGSGSGVSVVFPRPSYQTSYGLRTTGRSVPDISIQMGGCPGGISVQPCQPGRSAAIVVLAGSLYGVIGTSIGSPEMAGLVAVTVGSGKSRLGNINPLLYTRGLAPNASSYYYHQGIPGYNGVVTVRAGTPGYNQITGLGTPHAANLMGFPNAPLAGDPQTLSNP